jgi:hypothetical protein
VIDCKGCGRKRAWYTLKRDPGICLEGLMETIENLRLDIRPQVRELDPPPPQCERKANKWAATFIAWLLGICLLFMLC